MPNKKQSAKKEKKMLWEFSVSLRFFLPQKETCSTEAGLQSMVKGDNDNNNYEYYYYYHQYYEINYI